uniref:NADH-ubiquinone oxidoreductase chain 6 n=1 Tax=Rapisma zayuanum TaxID=1419480 RepID=V9PPA2_9NEOP|nr:NADH dehydrogenase subunit 6 [Rapisma zayuanum]AHA35677.1 NADH dehydrogenase subunit 6 [Rapisma zayuanum]
MNQFIILLNILFSINFLQLNHPLSLGLNLLIQTILISLIWGYFASSFWFSYILFLIMLGGLLILFIYVTSLASNELFSFSINNLFFLMIFLLISFIIFSIKDNFIWFQENLEIYKFNHSSINSINELNLIKLYNNPSMNITLLMINYLFLTLIIIVKITDINYGSLRHKNYV